MRFEEDVSPAPRAAESARFLLLLLAAGIVGGKGGRGCVMGAEGVAGGAAIQEDAAVTPGKAVRFPYNA
jgi:hypothetical protein